VACFPPLSWPPLVAFSALILAPVWKREGVLGAPCFQSGPSQEAHAFEVAFLLLMSVLNKMIMMLMHK